MKDFIMFLLAVMWTVMLAFLIEIDCFNIDVPWWR
jgi:hypothetical protein